LNDESSGERRLEISAFFDEENRKQIVRHLKEGENLSVSDGIPSIVYANLLAKNISSGTDLKVARVREAGSEGDGPAFLAKLNTPGASWIASLSAEAKIHITHNKSNTEVRISGPDGFCKIAAQNIATLKQLTDQH
jgi:hypothetical protein